MIGVFDIVLLALLGWTGLRLWTGTTSPTARAVSMASLALLAWFIVGP